MRLLPGCLRPPPPAAPFRSAPTRRSTTRRSSDPRDRLPVDELYDALDRLPPDLRVPWVLARIEQSTLPEVARICEISLATVKRRIADADARIERRLAP